jgi:hypothetical protein
VIAQHPERDRLAPRRKGSGWASRGEAWGWDAQWHRPQQRQARPVSGSPLGLRAPTFASRARCALSSSIIFLSQLQPPPHTPEGGAFWPHAGEKRGVARTERGPVKSLVETRNISVSLILFPPLASRPRSGARSKSPERFHELSAQ